jgi:hypothetical protein
MTTVWQGLQRAVALGQVSKSQEVISLSLGPSQDLEANIAVINKKTGHVYKCYEIALFILSLVRSVSEAKLGGLTYVLISGSTVVFIEDPWPH